MRFRSWMFALLVLVLIAALFSSKIATAQAPAKSPAPAPAKSAAPPAARAASGAKVEANLQQVMRAILFPNSNVIFAAQSTDPGTIKPEADPTQSPNPLTGSYGGWQAIENSGLALAESANLLIIPGRVCSNGKPVPMQNADWAKFVQELRDAGMATYKAAQTKKQDAIVDVTDQVSQACQDCHDVYREKTPKQGGLAARCTK
jgi:hypothetical protein